MGRRTINPFRKQTLPGYPIQIVISSTTRRMVIFTISFSLKLLVQNKKFGKRTMELYKSNIAGGVQENS